MLSKLKDTLLQIKKSSPIFLNQYSIIAKNSNNVESVVLSEQLSRFSEPEYLSSLVTEVEVNEGLLYDIINDSLNTKTLIVTYEDKGGNTLFSVEYNVLYRGMTGIEGDWGSNNIMKLKFYYQITSQILIEGDNKIRIK